MKSSDVLKVSLMLAVMAIGAFWQPIWAAEKGGNIMTFKMMTTAFEQGSEIPQKYTCEGQNISPPLSWENPPAGTKSFALIVDDPDAPSGTFTHWLLWDIPGDKTYLEEGTKEGISGKNDFGRIGYGGPCPPRGHGPHRYFFKLYALDVQSLNIKKGSTRLSLEKAMKGHIIEKTEYMGTYQR